MKSKGKEAKMIFRAEPEAIMFFSVSEGKTGIISGIELEKVVEWTNSGKENEFVNRLKKLNILENNLSTLERQRNELLKVIRIVEGCKGPIRSFANPESIHIDLTTRCNLNCIQCYKDRSLDVNLSFEQLKTFIREAADMKVFQIAFGGGEPLLYPFIKEAVYEVSSKGMGCSITTSGKGLEHDLIEELRKFGVNHIQISLNGSTEEINSRWFMLRW